ncbi:MAG: hypothetical protein ACOVN5_06005, partial [Aquidulcibacter sp.]
KATTVLAIEINEASAKIRRGPPGDPDEDLMQDVWAGVLPLEVRTLPPIPDPRGSVATPPEYLTRFKIG